MSPDEGFVLFLSLGVAAFTWARWYFRAARVHELVSRSSDRFALYAMPLLCLVLLWVVLILLASHDVQSSPMYQAFYAAMGAAWLGLAMEMAPLMGISPRDDVAERRNGAASTALSGAMLGVTLAFAGGNVGDGPGWWVVVFCAGLATATLFIAWWVLERLAPVMDWITIDRDNAAGMRLAGFLVAAGLVLGRAAAGDWHSTEATIRDFASIGWVVIPLGLVAAGADRLFGPTPQRPDAPLVAGGLFPALVLVGCAVGYVAWCGVPP